LQIIRQLHLNKWLKISLTFPLCIVLVCPTRVLWYINPYFGVSFFVFKARNKAFSAPRICTVEAGCFARLMREPEDNAQKSVNILTATVNSRNKEMVCVAKLPISATMHDLLSESYPILHFNDATHFSQMLYNAHISYLPACEISLAPTSSPTNTVRLGAMATILLRK
jgi:hypothetical protein